MDKYDFKHPADMNIGVDEFEHIEGAVLLDVRREDEYACGHVHGSTNIPVDEIERILEVVPDKDTLIFVHCLAGGRSHNATKALAEMGYTNVRNIGGIAAYMGHIEKCEEE